MVDCSIQGDVSTKKGCLDIAEKVKAKEARVDTLVNCAGVSKGWRQQAHPQDGKS